METGDDVLDHGLVVERVIDKKSSFEQCFDSFLFVFESSESPMKFRLRKRD